LGKELGNCLADVGVGGPQELFGLAYIRPTAFSPALSIVKRE